MTTFFRTLFVTSFLATLIVAGQYTLQGPSAQDALKDANIEALNELKNDPQFGDLANSLSSVIGQDSTPRQTTATINRQSFAIKRIKFWAYRNQNRILYSVLIAFGLAVAVNIYMENRRPRRRRF